jgi:hypothetical protein
MSAENEEDVFNYGDERIASAHNKVSPFLKAVYIIMPIWGIIWWFLYWNGTSGWLDRGYWQQLQRANSSAYPFINFNDQVSEENPESRIQNSES